MLAETRVETPSAEPEVGPAALIKGRSLWQDAGVRFMRNKAAVVSVIVLIAVVLFTFIGPLFAAWSIEKIDWSIIGMVAEKGQPSIETGHFFGADEVGRDLFSRVIQGTQISLAVGILGAAVAVVVGTLYGAVAGYFGGRLDSAMMRFVDIIYSIPFLFILILMLIIFGRSFVVLFMGIGLISWLGMARVVRGQTLTLKNREFVEAAIATGVKPLAVVFRHIVPNLLGIVVVYATLLIPEIILLESFISFLGLGIQEPNTSLGALISEGAQTMQYGELWQIGFPLAFFVVILFSFFFAGDGLRDALDPKDR
ncbi:MAG: peptide ABC transporter permease [Devosia sp. 67-54]|uniref:ABC transporter permease subunit n=1 Tax=unclassified Devosia TaxID=196773 RepID=UPI0009673C98|nr:MULTISPECIES: ABC transporter permease subunit [unclassified Devosia]MBN9306033.1 ABC transporter permease subunit [Devosia sp.]OJX16293.1 MAG: peptide ABC transporter permease [Devosia sp. 67-54]